MKCIITKIYFFLTKKLNSCFVTLKNIIFKTILELILKKLKNETGFFKTRFCSFKHCYNLNIINWLKSVR